MDVRLADFRRTILLTGRLGGARLYDQRGLEHYVLFDLGRESLLEPLAEDADQFRVTVYNPDLLKQTHSRGRHQYLIAREVIDADVVLNLPKLKAHKKACITGALKNLVGINGNKEYLPHHRKGGSESGGDCYEGRSRLKAAAEQIYDVANRRPSGLLQSALAQCAEFSLRCASTMGADRNLEGSWYGNDTIWRTSLDLQRVLLYGRADGTMQTAPARRVISITEAIIAGEGEGPLAPDPVPSGFVTGALNAAAAEWAHTRLMGFDPEKIPLVRQAFGAFAYPLTAFPPSAVCLRTRLGDVPAARAFPFEDRAFRPPAGWKNHCELLEHANDLSQEALLA
jgi:hypothetical protein